MPDVLAGLPTAVTIVFVVLLATGALYGAALTTGRRWLWITAVALTVAEVVGFVGCVKGWWF